jgi:hypothetical protein
VRTAFSPARLCPFGRTVELVRTMRVVSSQQTTVLRVVRNLAAFNGVVIVLLLAYATYLKLPLAVKAKPSSASARPWVDKRPTNPHRF